MDWEREWGLEQTGKIKRFLPYLFYVLIFGFIMAVLGGFASYLILSNTIKKQSIQTGSVVSMLNTSDLVVASVERNKHTVVGVINYHKIGNEKKFSPVDQSSGSGIIFQKAGGKAYIATNYHVIEGAHKIQIVTSEGEHIDAKVLGYDDLNDIAVLEIPSYKVLNVAELGDSEEIRIGETVIAIGNPLGIEYSETVTVGVVSGKNRILPVYFDGDDIPDWEIEVIQTDAAINFGNSGGALLNLQGEVIGINSAKIVEAGVESIGFSIPINLAKPIMTEIITNGKVIRPYLGVIPVDLSTVSKETMLTLKLPKNIEHGVLLWRQPEGPAHKAGLKKNDVIVKIDDVEITSQLSLRKTIYHKKIGDKVEITFYRNGKKFETFVILEEMP